ncbi:HD domain-containing protein [Mesoterricola sediminis]|uniref:HDIG domain-containing protein n=1 Tax=Mesoterricola sediminis TaxID=2927980 RepID=A0AA48KEN2_9BACT|nr:HD domain-containing protein [Mesoterricola sediminis]BDU77467.1 HDIG domain-containing protein [Mesoterricola sediminis]
MLTRDEALSLMHEWTPSERLRIHALGVARVMEDLARRLGQDPEVYGVAGLLHDADYDRWPEEHPARIVAWLEARGEAELARAIAAHATVRTGVRAESLLERALVASDEVTGFVTACALVRPQRTEGLEPRSIRKKMKTPAFAAGVDREELIEGFRRLAELIGGTEDEHFQRVVDVLHAHRAELGLA